MRYRERRLKLTPRQGFTTVTISNEIYEKLKAGMKKANDQAGYRKFRSVAHYTEFLIMQGTEEKKK